MKKALLILSIAVVAMGSCKKKSSTTTVTPVTLPVYTIDGIHDLYMTGNSAFVSTATLLITVQFQDSFQKQVTLSLSDLPAGIKVDDRWITSGYPTFSTAITFYDTSFTSAAAEGTYPMTITATGSAGTQKFNFNLKVAKPESCTDNIVGTYYTSNTTCNFGSYVDTVFADATTVNKIWFKNIGKSHSTVYALYSCIDGRLLIPTQSANGYTFTGHGTAAATSSSHSISMTITYGSDTCDVSMH
ncbi:MAG: hypothetical protein JWQ38_67 [Flavipsychrobacter sp.]|nr:hypothetical protein [Flavipsychrobacter sp.]